ncbi:glycosyl transferase [Flavobacterium magnum]|uniref:Glycosyl transferase n=1 Tax=Flavobacterium magnum TaxID=2162713 RepID=A0A2S0RBK9_9FLAO|nr:glycosyltransferase [Flavobacterium magnum]AWA28934.1 glycosyl transferase [Flavobacterium magnum]
MIVTAIILGLYCLMIFSLVYGFSKVESAVPEPGGPVTKFSIVVPFRNEAENLPDLLAHLSALNYPDHLYEIILVDDDSGDGFTTQDDRYRLVRNIRASASPKKDAILTAIATAKHEWIVTTDADCIVSENWLRMLDGFIRKTHPQMVVGAVTYVPGNGFLQQFQQSDLAALQGVTIGSFGLGMPFLCNGANFAYTKTIFNQLDGFRGNLNHAGGDDVFLLQKAIAALPDQVAYLRSGEYTVLTKPAKTWRELFQQRVRWASKTGAYQSRAARITGALAFFGNLAWIAGLFLFIANPGRWIILVLLLLKWCADGVLIATANRFLGQPTRYYAASATLYPFFSTVVALYSIFGKYEWKGRRF